VSACFATRALLHVYVVSVDVPASPRSRSTSRARDRRPGMCINKLRYARWTCKINVSAKRLIEQKDIGTGTYKT
jgi:hypothetical protein